MSTDTARPLVVGIDLGTTFSALATVQADGTPHVVTNAEGERLTPSVLYVADGLVQVGSGALEAGAVHPERCIANAKRHMGDADWGVTIDGHRVDATLCATFLLQKLARDAAAALGAPVGEAVITVPAWFGERERRATAEAAAQAGLSVLALLNEPTAAAFAYGLANATSDTEQRVLVLDLGGGTCDASIVGIAGRDIGVIATAGDPHLGGTDWDDALVAHAAAAFHERHGVDLLADPLRAHDLRRRCVAAKLALSRRDGVQLLLDFDGRVLRTEIARATFEALTAPLLARVEGLVRKVLLDAGMVPADLSRVVLAGGSTRMPMVRALVRRATGTEPDSSIDPEACVASGAALLAAVLVAARDGSDSPVALQPSDITGHDLGVVALQGDTPACVPVIPRRSTLPATAHLDLVTARDGQRSADVWLVQGEGTLLGCVSFDGIPDAPAGTPLRVSVRHGEDGLVAVEAHLANGTPLQPRISASEATPPPLEALASGHVPSALALVMDASGSTFGEPWSRLCESARATLEGYRGPHRRVALHVSPGGFGERVGAPTCRVASTADPGALHHALRAQVPAGPSTLHEALRDAGETLAAGAGTHRFAVLYTDGRVEDPDALLASVATLRAASVDVRVVASPTGADEDFLRLLCDGSPLVVAPAAPLLVPTGALPRLPTQGGAP